MSIRDVMTNPDLFGNQFSGDSFRAWRALLAGFYGLTLSSDEMSYYQSLTGRENASKTPHDELWLVVGRRGGKSLLSALIAIYESAFKVYDDRLNSGEVATVMLLAGDRKQARSVFRYIIGLLESNLMLSKMIVRIDKDSIELINRTVIEVHTASFRATRGYTVACCIADEVAFWRSDESANPDHEILNAIRPAMSTLNGKLIALSSPYSRRGALWDAYKKHYGKDSPILVAQASSQEMNPTLPQKVIDQAMDRDPASAKAEYLAEFRNDVETFVSIEAVEACTAYGRIELPPISENRYRAFTDPSGGSKDAWTLAIAHKEDETMVIDAVRSIKPPFSPEAVVKEFSGLLKQYRVSEVTGDRYGGEFPRELFRKQGITYKLSDRPASDLYLETLPLLNSGKVELLENQQLHKELIGLERRTARSGKDSISHAPNAHDDLANSVAGVIIELSKKRSLPRVRRFDSDQERFLIANQNGSERFRHPYGLEERVFFQNQRN